MKKLIRNNTHPYALQVKSGNSESIKGFSLFGGIGGINKNFKDGCLVESGIEVKLIRHAFLEDSNYEKLIAQIIETPIMINKTQLIPQENKSQIYQRVFIQQQDAMGDVYADFLEPDNFALLNNICSCEGEYILNGLTNICFEEILPFAEFLFYVYEKE